MIQSIFYCIVQGFSLFWKCDFHKILLFVLHMHLNSEWISKLLLLYWIHCSVCEEKSSWLADYRQISIRSYQNIKPTCKHPFCLHFLQIPESNQSRTSIPHIILCNFAFQLEHWILACGTGCLLSFGKKWFWPTKTSNSLGCLGVRNNCLKE